MNSPKIVDLTSDAPFVELRAEWNELAQRLESTSYFLSGDWAHAWWCAHAQPPHGEVATWRSVDGALVAIVALYEQTARAHPTIPMRIRCLAPVGSGIGGADHGGFLVDPVVEHEVRQWIQSRLRHESLLARHVSPERRTVDLVPGATIVGREVNLSSTLPLPITPSFAKRLQRYTRRLEREGVSFESVAPGLVGAELIGSFDALQRRRRREQGRTSSVSDFHLRLLRDLAQHGRPGWGLAATVARLGDEPVGVLLGFQTARRFEFFQIGWKPELASLSIGSVLIDITARWAADRGATEFDFLRGDDDYKRRFGAQPVFDEHVLRPSGLSGRLLLHREVRRARRPLSSSRAAPSESLIES